MRTRSRRNHFGVFKAKVAQRFSVHSKQITKWKSQLLARAADLFASVVERRAESDDVALKDLRAKIGQQSLEIDFVWPACLDRFPD